jgi:hypothetical protein
MVDGSSFVDFGPNVVIENATLSGNMVSCPECHRPVNIIEGTFSIRDGIIDVITASNWTRAKLAEYQSALQWAADNFEAQPDAALDRIDSVSPETASFLRRMIQGPWTRADVLAFLSMLLTLAGFIYAVTTGNDPVHVTNEQVVQIFNQAPEHFSWLHGGGPARPGP